MEKENFYGLTEVPMRENSKIIISTEMEPTAGLMEENSSVNGKIIKWMVSVSLSGLMEESIKDNI